VYHSDDCGSHPVGQQKRESVAINARWIPKFTLNDIIRAAIGLALVFLFLAHEAEWKEMRFLQQLELWAYDTRLRLFLPKTRDTRVVIVDID
jgi:adenylate cyclase